MYEQNIENSMENNVSYNIVFDNPQILQIALY